MSTRPTRPFETPTETELSVDGEGAGQLLLDVLSDEPSRSILAATGDEALSAKEVSNRCGVPISSTYRKIDRLTEAGLLDERIRICSSGKHVSEYERSVDDVHLTVDDAGGFTLTLER